jgi:hypothetical protein
MKFLDLDQLSSYIKILSILKRLSSFVINLSSYSGLIRSSEDAILRLVTLFFWNLYVAHYFEQSRAFQKLELFLLSGEKVGRHLLSCIR